MAGQSDGAVTYHSMCDAVLVGESGERENVRADVVNLRSDGTGQAQVQTIESDLILIYFGIAGTTANDLILISWLWLMCKWLRLQ